MRTPIVAYLVGYLLQWRLAQSVVVLVVRYALRRRARRAPTLRRAVHRV